MRTATLLVLASCASSAIPAARFANAPAVQVVDDRRDVPVTPHDRPFFAMLYHYDGSIQRPLVRALELEPRRRALGVNAVDEVPDSTWFTNRIGVRELSLDELRAGPATVDSPELHKPWTITSTKVGGTEIGFIFKDARGFKFLLKFDPRGLAEVETATHVIVGKLLWAFGYNTTEDYVVMFGHDDLVLAPDAKMKDADGHVSPLSRAELESRLARVEHQPDGTLRGMASRWVNGKPIGGHPAEGVREDDPNDRIPHERRRDLRGSSVLFAWLDHVDLQESNFLDMWVADPRDPKRHYVEHFMIDFGKAMGVMATTEHDPRHGYEYTIDVSEMARSLVSAGLTLRSWEGRRLPGLRGVGMFTADDFNPGAWKADFPSYVPVIDADRFDAFWAAKILMRLTREQIRAIVETGRYSDPRATAYITDTLVARQRASARYWFARVNPLDGFAISPAGELCFDDLAIKYQLGPRAAATSYKLVTFDRAGTRLGQHFGEAEGRGHACVGLPALSGEADAYTIVRVETQRGEMAGQTFVHVARAADGALRVIGIWRT